MWLAFLFHGEGTGLSRGAGSKVGSQPMANSVMSVSIPKVWTPGLVCLHWVYKNTEVVLLLTHKNSIIA